jgi:Domain of unknown function (DUF4234)
MAAEEVQIAGTQATAKLRSPVWVAVLGLVTLGIYSLFWWYFINREMADLGRAKGVDLGDSPAKSVLAIIPGALIIVPAIMTLYNTFKRGHTAQGTVGVPQLNGWIALLLLLVFSPAAYAYLQSELNKVWRTVS